MGVRVRDGEKTSDWEPTDEAIDLGVLGLTELAKEYDELEDQIKIKVERRDAIKEAIKAYGGNRVIKVNGVDCFQLRNDGQFMPKQFRKDYEAEYVRFSRRVSAVEFDLDRFKEECPDLYAKYRASKIVRITAA